MFHSRVFPPTRYFCPPEIFHSKVFFSTIIFPFYSVFHLLRNITHYSVPTSPFNVFPPYWLFSFHWIFIFCMKPTFFGWFLPLTNMFFTTIFLIIRSFPTFKMFFLEYLYLYEYVFLFNIFTLLCIAPLKIYFFFRYIFHCRPVFTSKYSRHLCLQIILRYSGLFLLPRVATYPCIYFLYYGYDFQFRTTDEDWCCIYLQRKDFFVFGKVV